LSKKKKELQEKISEADHFKRIALLGLIVGIVLIVLGLFMFEPLFILGLAIFMICTGITSFLATLKWQYARVLKMEANEKEKPPPINVCPRCGIKVEKSLKYCSKCGKKIQAKKH